MELTLIAAGLLAAVAGLAVAVACALRVVAVHRHDLAAAGMRAARRSPVRRLLAGCEPLAARIRSRVAPGWFFSLSAALGLSFIALAAAVTGTVVEDVTNGDGAAVLDRPVAAFVAARRSGALTAVMREVSAVGGPVVLAAVTAAAGVLLAILRRHWGPAVAAAVTVAGSAVLIVVFKQALGRPRPRWPGPWPRRTATRSRPRTPPSPRRRSACWPTCARPGSGRGRAGSRSGPPRRSWPPLSASPASTWACTGPPTCSAAGPSVPAGRPCVITGWTAARHAPAGRLPGRARPWALPSQVPCGIRRECAGVR